MLEKATASRAVPQHNNYQSYRYKKDVNALNQLLNAQEEENMDEIRALVVKSIQDTRKNNREVRFMHMVFNTQLECL